MKKSSYIIGIISLSIILIGTTFKASHLPGASILLTVGIGCLSFIFLPIVYFQLLRSTNDGLLKWVYHAAFISFFIDFVGMLFKIMHWPGASKLLMIGIPLPFILFLPFYISYHNKRKLKTDNSFFGILLFMIYLGVFSSLLAINYSKDYIYSYITSVETIEIGNQNISNQLPKDSKALFMVDELQRIKKNLEMLDNKQYENSINNSKSINYRMLTAKDKKPGKATLRKAGIEKFNIEFERYKENVLKEDNSEITQRLFKEIDIYRVPKKEGDYPIIWQLTLINTLNILTDWQNKILLIEYLSNK